MLKFKKIAAFLTFFSVFGSFAALAQNTQQFPPQQQTQKVEVSDTELSKFANAFQGIRMINQEAQEEMIGTIEKEGMEVPRFNEIYEASQNPQAEVESTEEEEKQFEIIAAEIGKLQVAFQGKVEKVITDAELSLERYQEIAMGLQADPELQERLKKVFEG